MTNWHEIFVSEAAKPYYKALQTKLNEECRHYIIYPKVEDVFNAFTLTPFEEVKVIIIGQDPYHEEHQACGLAFSVQDGVKLPPSLINIYKEIAAEYQTVMPDSGDLSGWAKQGVLLLNTILTVRSGEAMSHANIGWETFTNNIIRICSEQKSHLVFLLMGRAAQAKIELIDRCKHDIITCAHPSPLSAYHGFFGSNVFKKVNESLICHHQTPIDWTKTRQ